MRLLNCSIMAAALILATPATAAVEPDCVTNALTSEQNAALDAAIAADSISQLGLQQASAIVVPAARVCAATYGWSVDAANAGADIAIYRRALLVVADEGQLGGAATGRLESFLATENPDDVRRLSNSSMRGDERARMVLRMIRATGPMEEGDNRWAVAYLIARERLADRLERFAGL